MSADTCYDTSIVHDVFGRNEVLSTLSERDQQIVLAQLQNLVMALRTNAKFRRPQGGSGGVGGAGGGAGAASGMGLAHSRSSSADLSMFQPQSPDGGASPVDAALHATGGAAVGDVSVMQASPGPAATIHHPLVQNALSLRLRLLQPLTGPLSSSSRRTGLNGVVLLEPFLQVMASSETTEPISAVAMVAVITFLDLHCDFLTPQAIVRVCDTARVTRGEMMDPQSHDAFLARIIQVFVACFRHPAAAHVPEDLPVQVFESIMRIGNEAQSELLRRVSEQGMNDIVSACYTHATSSTSSEVARFPSLLRLICRIITADPSIAGAARSPLATQLQGLCLAHTALLVLRDNIAAPHFQSVMAVVRNELPRALLSVGKHSDHIVVLAQVLRTMHLLFSFASIHLVPQLVSFLQFLLQRGGVAPAAAIMLGSGNGTSVGDANSNTINNSTNNTATSGRREGSPGASPVMMSPRRLDSTTDFSPAVAPRPKFEELQIESLWEFLGHEAFPAFLIHHVDLSLDGKAMFPLLCRALADACVPAGAATLNHINVLPLDCLLVVLNHVHARIGRRQQAIVQAAASGKPIEECAPMPAPLHDKKHYKDLLDIFIRAFAESAKNAVKAVYNTWSEDERVAFGFVRDAKQLHGAKLGAFLFKHRLQLDAKALVDYVGELGNSTEGYPDEKFGLEVREQWLRDTDCDVCAVGTPRFFHEVRIGFIESHSFRGKPLLLCLRELCFGFRVSGEAQKIDRIMEEFSVQWYVANSDAPRDIMPFKGKDAPFILSFAIIMLNTDLHIAKLPKKMTRDEFISRHRGLDVGGSNIPDSYLGTIYDDVKKQQIVFVDMLTQVSDCDVVNDFAWFKEVEEATSIAARATPDASAASAAAVVSLLTQDDELLLGYDQLVMQMFWRPCAETFLRIVALAGDALPSPPLPARSSTTTTTSTRNYHRDPAAAAAAASHQDASRDLMMKKPPQPQPPTVSLRESLALVEQMVPSAELLESVNRGIQSLALTGYRLGQPKVPDMLVSRLLDESCGYLDLSGRSDAPFAQLVDLGQRVSPLLALDTLFRGFLADVIDALEPDTFMNIARCIVKLLLCGAFSTALTPSQKHVADPAAPMRDLVATPASAGDASSSPPPPSSLASLASPSAPPSASTASTAAPSPQRSSSFFSQQQQLPELLIQESNVAKPPAPRMAADRQPEQQQQQQSGGGWFSFFGGGSSSTPTTAHADSSGSGGFDGSGSGGGGGVSARVANASVEEKTAAVQRLRSALPSLYELFFTFDRFSSASLRLLVGSLVAVIDDGSLVAPKWKDDLVSLGSAFVVEVLIQCPAHSDGLETLVRSFLQEQLDSASKKAGTNIVRSVLRYAHFTSSQMQSASSPSDAAPWRVLELISSVQGLTPAAFAPIVRDILVSIESQVQNYAAAIALGGAPLKRKIDDPVWKAILRILISAGRVSESKDATMQQPQSNEYSAKLHALSILGQIVRRKLLPLHLSTEAAETAASFALLDIPSRVAAAQQQQQEQSQQQQQQEQAPAWTAIPGTDASPLVFNTDNGGGGAASASPAAGTSSVSLESSLRDSAAAGSSSGGTAGVGTAAGANFEDRPIPILDAIHDRLIDGMKAAAAKSASGDADAAAAAEHDRVAEVWLKFAVAITMAIVAAAEHSSTHAAMELVNVLSNLVTGPSLKPAHAVQLLEAVLLPVVDRVCTQLAQNMAAPPQSPPIDLNATGKNGQSRELSLLSPTDLLTYMLGPLAGPETPIKKGRDGATGGAGATGDAATTTAVAVAPSAHRCADEVKCAVLRLVASTTMHYFDTLAASRKQFLPLWERVLGSYYAVYTRAHPAPESADVREAIQHTVLNLVRVTVTMAQGAGGEHSAAFAMHPLLWKTTRDFLRRFEFGQALDQELEKLGYA